MTPRFHRLRVASVRAETADAIRVWLEVPAGLAEAYRFAPGQHLTLRALVDGTSLRRSYSICSGLDDGDLSVAIKRVEQGRFSNWAHANLRPGRSIDVMTPDGRFGCAPEPSLARHHVAFAAGSGITPVISLARTLLAREPASRFTLVYGNRDVASVMFHEALEDLKDRHLARFALIHVFSREAHEVPLFNGRIDRQRTQALLGSLVPAASIDDAWVCGPAGMIDAVTAALRDAGVPDASVHVERFHAGGADDADPHPGPLPQAGKGEGRLRERRADARERVVDSGTRLTIVVDGLCRQIDFASQESVLDAGIAAGLDLPYSCKGGMCCTCRAKVISGEVRMKRNFALEPRDVASGFVLTCQAVPLTDELTVSYDERS